MVEEESLFCEEEVVVGRVDGMVSNANVGGLDGNKKLARSVKGLEEASFWLLVENVRVVVVSGRVLRKCLIILKIRIKVNFEKVSVNFVKQTKIKNLIRCLWIEEEVQKMLWIEEKIEIWAII